jgi:hypothetical protein
MAKRKFKGLTEISGLSDPEPRGACSQWVQARLRVMPER